jgi:hypothetical protein
MNTKEEKTFKQDNECYAVCFRCAFDGVPVTHDSYIFKENSTYVTGSNIKVYYSKNGVIGMKWNGWYDVQETAESPDSLITVQDALDKAYEDFNSMQDSSKQIVIKEARFEYAVIPNVENTDEFNLVPSWSLIYSIKSDNSSDTVTNMLHVNAATGEIINTPYWQLKK